MVVQDSGGRIRYAVQGLLSAWGGHDRLCADLMAEAKRDTERLARMLNGVTHGGVALAEQVVDIMRTGTTLAEAELRKAGEHYSIETRALLALLTGEPHLASAPFSLPEPGSGLDGIVASFPTEDSRRYIRHTLDDHPASSTHPGDRSAASPTTGPDAPAHRVDAFLLLFAPELRHDIERMITHPRCHPIQAHGPDVTDEAIKARLSHRKDPVGRANRTHRWDRHPDNTVTTNHRVGAVVGRFNTIDALAKPLQVVIQASGGTIAGLDAVLTRSGDGGRARLFVTAGECGLEPGDTAGYRGAGTQTQKMADDWTKARDYAMATGIEPMPVVPTDQIADGGDPGAAMIFRKIDNTWIMTTCYPVAKAPHDFTRLRGSIS